MKERHKIITHLNSYGALKYVLFFGVRGKRGPRPDKEERDRARNDPSLEDRTFVYGVRTEVRTPGRRGVVGQVGGKWPGPFSIVLPWGPPSWCLVPASPGHPKA